MASDQQNLTHDEVWDDSALVDSWNDALGEYKVVCTLRKSTSVLLTVFRNIIASIGMAATSMTS